ncbi:MAG: hypothetical protein C0453_03190 [Comamonadaceae bacterium]|nr:hypothetical protein [Comamonadaceae bacterium]
MDCGSQHRALPRVAPLSRLVAVDTVARAPRGPPAGGNALKPAFKKSWTWAKRLAPWVLAGAVVYLLFDYAKEVDWSEVWQTLKAFPVSLLLVSAGLALLSHAVYASYDVIGRLLTRHPVGPVRSWGIAAISFAFNLNFGALIGGLGLRLRLYTRRGLDLGTVGQVAMYSVLTNWLGWCWVAGVALTLTPLRVDVEWVPGVTALRILGVALLLGAVSYHAMCARWGGATMQVREQRITLPKWRVSTMQGGLGALSWLLMGLSMCNLLGWRIDYPTVLGVLLLAAVAGAIAHVPAGLGVLEAVFVAALHGRLPTTDILAAVLAYRALHHLLPLSLALPAYALDEATAKRQTA